ncbi:MAG TPA: hypothetical protein VLJ39_10820 [Tepidisphaeraceae bacterium]|nr:hypothetical protein [Tepidisphaeraceae bacterium]
MRLQFISPTVHGILDYLTAAMLPSTPRMFGFSRKVTRLHDVVGAATLGSALVTDYPLGAVKVLPLKAHLAMDVFHGGLFLACAAIMADEPTPTRACMTASGLFLLTTGLCTQTQKKEQAPEQGSFARQHPVERYAEQTRPDIYSPQRTGVVSGL